MRLPMKAASCLRQGASKFTQVFGSFFGGPKEACSLGVIFYTALDLQDCESISGAAWVKIEKTLPCLFRDDFGALPCGCAMQEISAHGLSGTPVLGKLGHAIAHMNDYHKWSFTAIAEWLEGIVFSK